MPQVDESLENDGYFCVARTLGNIVEFWSGWCWSDTTPVGWTEPASALSVAQKFRKDSAVEGRVHVVFLKKRIVTGEEQGESVPLKIAQR